MGSVAGVLGNRFSLNDVFLFKVCQGSDCSEFLARRAGTKLVVEFGVRAPPGYDARVFRQSLSSSSFVEALLTSFSAASGKTITGELANEVGANSSTTITNISASAAITTFTSGTRPESTVAEG